MALAPRLDLRQTQSLVMTPQLQQAIKLLALSNLEVETFIGEALDANPLLEIGEAAAPPDPLDGLPEGQLLKRRTDKLKAELEAQLARRVPKGHALYPTFFAEQLLCDEYLERKEA